MDSISYVQICRATASLLIALLIFTVQLIFSRWWLARHKQGPLEFLWRGGNGFSVFPLFEFEQKLLDKFVAKPSPDLPESGGLLPYRQIRKDSLYFDV